MVGAPVRFGTSGWRGILGEEVNERRTRAVAAGVAVWLRDASMEGPVVVAHDRRLGGERLARAAGQVLQREGFAVIRAPGPTPTPAVARFVPRVGAAAGLVFTASHNAASDHGLKVLDARGASAREAATKAIEAATKGIEAATRDDWPRAGRDDRSGATQGRAAGARVQDLSGGYARDLARVVEGSVVRRAGIRIAYDAMHGAGALVLPQALASLGVEVDALRAERNVRFGGAAPDPLPERLRALSRRVAGDTSLSFGIATDGDADRFAVTDARGRFLSETGAVALLVEHLARLGRVGRGVAISIATGSLVEAVAREHGLAVSRHPIGFKHLADALHEGSADVAGEESGGFAWGSFSLDKDGMLAACLLAERAAEEPLAEGLARLERRHGRRACGRIALVASPAARERLERLGRRPPSRLGGARVTDVDRRDGLRLAVGDGFVMLRASGTEAVLRVYAEAPDSRGLRARFAEGAALLGLAWTPSPRADTL